MQRCVAERLESRQLLSADLAGSFTGVAPTALLPGGRNKLVLRLDNSGDAATLGETVGITLLASADDTAGAGDFTLATASKRLKLNPAKGINVNLSFPSPTDVPDGNYFLLAQIDTAGVVTENSEDNNLARTSGTVEIRQPFVDLSATADVIAGTIVIAEGKKPKAPKVSLVFSNGGNVPAFGNLTANVFASTDTTVGDADDVSLGTTTRKTGLKPGKFLKFKPKLTIPGDLPTGEYNVVATFDYTGTNANESTPNDNRAVSSTKFSVNNPAFPGGPDEEQPPLVTGLTADVETLLVGTPEQIIFEVPITGAAPPQTASLNEISGASATKIADLKDDGVFPDAVAADGIFSGMTAIQFDAPGQRSFRADLSSVSFQSATVTVTGVAAPSEAQVQATIDNANARQAQLDAALTGGASDAAAIETIRQFLLTQGDVVASSIQVGADAITYVNAQGIQTYLTTKQSSTPPPDPEPLNNPSNVAALTAADPALDCGCGGDMSSLIGPFADGEPVACDRAAVIAAYDNTLAGGGSIGNLLLNPPDTGQVSQATFSLSPFIAAGVDVFKGLGQYKFMYIAADSFAINGGIGIKTAEAASTLRSIALAADIISGRVAVSAATDFDPTPKYVLTPKFFLHYNGDMDGAIVIFNSDFSTADGALPGAFIRRGAKAFYGFTGARGDPGNVFYSQQPLETTRALLSDQTVEQALTAGGLTSPDPSNEYTFFGTAEAKLEAGCDLLSENDLVVQYTWNQSQKDLDTGTDFLGATVGFRCSGPNDFMTFTGDDTTSGGSETVTINLKGAFDAGLFTTSTSVTAMAGWFSGANPVGTGPAVLTVALKSKINSELRQVLTRTIIPGTQSECAATLVGVVNVAVTQEANPRVSITLT